MLRTILVAYLLTSMINIRAHAQSPWTFTTWGTNSISEEYQLPWVTNQYTPFGGPVDLNGDGLADIPNAISTGTNFSASAALPTQSCFNGNFDGSGRTSSVCVELANVTQYVTPPQTYNSISYARPLGNSYGQTMTQTFPLPPKQTLTNIVNGSITFTTGANIAYGTVTGCYVMDVNGDGRSDLVCPMYILSGNVAPNYYSFLGVYLATGSLSTSNAFTFQVWNLPANTLSELNGGAPYTAGDEIGNCLVGDFNGDGLEDLSCPRPTLNSSGNFVLTNAWVTLFSTGTGISAQNWSFKVGTWPTAGELLSPSVNLGCQAADFNGDGVTDIACPASSGWGMAFGGSSSTFSSQSLWTASMTFDSTGVPFFCTGADIYGVGRSGIICYSPGISATSWTYFSSNGNSFTPTTFTTPSSWNLSTIYYLDENSLATKHIYQACIFGDYNGDGILDIACPMVGGGFNMGLSSRPN